MQRTARSVPDREREVSEMRRLIGAIAREVRRLYGARGTLDWTAVERHLGGIVQQARADARRSRSLPGSVVRTARSPTGLAARRWKARQADQAGARS